MNQKFEDVFESKVVNKAPLVRNVLAMTGEITILGKVLRSAASSRS